MGIRVCVGWFNLAEMIPIRSGRGFLSEILLVTERGVIIEAYWIQSLEQTYNIIVRIWHQENVICQTSADDFWIYSPWSLESS